MLRYKDANGTWRRAPAARGANGRVRPNFVVVDGKQTRIENGAYELRFYKNRQAVYKPAGRSAAAADAQCRKMQRQSTAIAAAEAAGVQVIREPDRKTLAGSSAEYIKDCRDRGAMEAAAQAQQVCDEFCMEIKKTFLDELTRDDVLRFHKALRKRGMSDRTVANKHGRLKSWLIFAKVNLEFMPPAPKYEEGLPTVYASEQITKILNAADDYMKLTVSLALMCGLREQELMYLEWPDINEEDSVLRVRGKAQYGFKVKDSEQRDIPIPPDLLAMLRAWRKTHGEKRLVLATSSGAPNAHLLRRLKRLAYHAGLNCGHCDGCKERHECEEWALHRFRRTFATRMLRVFDLRTVQLLMGHADLASTMRYLAPASSEEVRSRLAMVKW